jgi:hypothetical protein
VFDHVETEAYSRLVQNPAKPRFTTRRTTPHPAQLWYYHLSYILASCHLLLIQHNQTSQNRNLDARFSTYSGAPSLQPSLAPTYSTGASASQRNTQTINEKSSTAMSGSSFYANADQGAVSSVTLNSKDPKTQDITQWSKGFERMQDERLDKQRYVMSGNKSEEVSKLALGAKLERALGRRMTGQDASFSRSKRPVDNEKRSLDTVRVN